MNWAAIRDVVLFALAIYASLLSSLNFFQARRKDRRSVRVVASTVMPTYGPKVGPPYMKIEAVNDGHRTVTITVISLQLPNKSRLWSFMPTSIPAFPDTSLPAQLNEGDVAHKTIPYAAVGEALIRQGFGTKVRLTPVCEDTLGSHYYGEAWEIDPKEWMTMNE